MISWLCFVPNPSTDINMSCKLEQEISKKQKWNISICTHNKKIYQYSGDSMPRCNLSLLQRHGFWTAHKVCMWSKFIYWCLHMLSHEDKEGMSAIWISKCWLCVICTILEIYWEKGQIWPVEWNYYIPNLCLH